MNSSIQKTGNNLIITISADTDDLTPTVRSVYNRLRQSVSASGFRQGKAPNNIIERELGLERVHAEVIDAAAEKLYRQALGDEQIRPISHPHVSVKKFVPYTSLDLEITVEIMPEIKLPDYSKISKVQESVKVDKNEIDEVMQSLQERLAKRQEVKREAKTGDAVNIDFKGTREGKPVPGAEASGYELILGSNQFIPGFEDELLGLKAGDTKKFTIKFPKDYPEDSLADKKIDFEVTLNKVLEIKKPKLDDEFAKQAGPFKDLAGLKSDISEHLSSEKQQAAQKQLENEVVGEIVKQTKIDIPESMIEQERNRIKEEIAGQLADRGMDEEAYLKQTGKSASDHQNEIDSQATERIKTALVLTEVAKKENLQVTPEELEIRLQLLAGQYQDNKIQEELQKPQIKQEIANQMLAEKTVKYLVEKVTKSGNDKAKSTKKKGKQ